MIFAGSLRRRKEPVRDIDTLAVSDHPVELVEPFTTMPGVVEIYARGVTKALVRLSALVYADLRVVPPESWGAGLIYSTGNKDPNVAIRRMAVDQGL